MALWVSKFQVTTNTDCMRKTFLALVLASLTLAMGCSGPSYKLGRGINNTTEILRMGEMRRSIEQVSLWNDPSQGFTFGAIQGFNRTIVRTAYGIAEIATFPIPTPSYDAFYLQKEQAPGNGDTYIGGPYRKDQVWSTDFMSENPRYPASYAPSQLADSMFASDTNLGFSGGDIAPAFMGSRFRVFDK